MSYTAEEIHNMAITVIDEISDNGTIDVNKTKEYANRAPRLLDMWQKEISKNGDLYKTFEISCFRKNNLLSEFDSFTAIEHTDTDQIYEATGANSFQFGVDSDASVHIEEYASGIWINLAGTYIDEQTNIPTAFTGLIEATSTTSSYNHYKGIFSTSNKVRMRFSGDYYYRHINRALIPYKYSGVSKVPDFKPWYKIDMPTDFKTKTQVVNEFPMWQYEEDSSHKWEGDSDLYIHFGYEGIVRITYVPIPIKITSLAQTIEVDDVTATSGAYYLAEHYALADQNDTLAKMCSAKFRQLKLDSMVKKPLSPTEIADVYNLGGV